MLKHSSTFTKRTVASCLGFQPSSERKSYIFFVVGQKLLPCWDWMAARFYQERKSGIKECRVRINEKFLNNLNSDFSQTNVGIRFTSKVSDWFLHLPLKDQRLMHLYVE